MNGWMEMEFGWVREMELGGGACGERVNGEGWVQWGNIFVGVCERNGRIRNVGDGGDGDVSYSNSTGSVGKHSNEG